MSISRFNPIYGVMCVSNVNYDQYKRKDECFEIIESMNFGDISRIVYLLDKKSKKQNMYKIYVTYSNLNEDNEILDSYFEKMTESKEKKEKNTFKLSINHDFKFNDGETKKFWIAKFKNRNTFNVGEHIWDALIPSQ